MASAPICPACPECNESKLSDTASIFTLCTFAYVVIAGILYYLQAFTECASSLEALVASTRSLYQEFEFLYDDATAIERGPAVLTTANDEAKRSRAALSLFSISRDVAGQMKDLIRLAAESESRLSGGRFRNRGHLIILRAEMTRKHGAAVDGVSKFRTALFQYKQHEDSLYRRRQDEALEAQDLTLQRQQSLLEEVLTRLKNLDQTQQTSR